MTNDYYKNHANTEIGLKVKETDNVEKKTLTSLIWQAEGGMEAFLKKSEAYVLDRTTTKLAEALEKDGVSNDRAALMKGIADRRKEIEKYGIMSRKDTFTWEEDSNVHGFVIVENVEKKKDDQRIGYITDHSTHIDLFEHTKKLKAVDLSGDPDKDLKKLTLIMDQLELAEQASDYRKNRMGSYYLERSGKDIEISDKLIDSKEIIRNLQNDLLIIAGLNEYGSVDSTKSREDIKAARNRYEGHLRDYRGLVQNLTDINNMKYMPGKETSPEHYQTDKHEGEVEDAELVKERTKNLIATLASKRFSDIELYNYRETIGELYVVCQDEKQKEVLKVALDRAVYLWTQKRIIDLEAATKDNPDDNDLMLQKLTMVSQELNDDRGVDKTIEPLIKLRREAEKAAYEYEDIKAVALNYNDQQEWMETTRETNISGPGASFLIWAGKIFMSDKRTFDHGEMRYDESVKKMKKIPKALSEISSKNIKMQIGDKSAVPPVEVSKYFADPDKAYLSGLCEETKKEIKKGLKEYPPDVLKAVEAIGYYSGLQGLINGQTVEMEMGMLHELRKAALKKKAAAVTIDGHVITSLDTKLYNGHWFVLIRDTHNIYHYTYKKDEQGNLKGNLFRGTFELLGGKDFVQEIGEEPGGAFIGTSWWELKDLAKLTNSVITGVD